MPQNIKLVRPKANSAYNTSLLLQAVDRFPHVTHLKVLQISFHEKGTEGYSTLLFDGNSDLLFFPDHLNALLLRLHYIRQNTYPENKLLSMEISAEAPPKQIM